MLIATCNFFNGIKPQKFFLFSATLFFLIYNFVTPPLQAPDELNHFCRAYRIAQGNFLPEKKDQRLGGEIPKSFYEFLVPYTFASTSFDYKIDKEIISSSFNYLFSEETVFQDFPNTSYYSLVSYLPQASAIFVFQKLNCSIATTYYGGRILVFLVWLLCMFIAIKTIPLYKWLFTLLILLPMNLYVVNSFSADTVTGILAFLFIAFVLKLAFDDDIIAGKDVAALLILLGLLALAKLVYIGLIVLLFLIPAQKFKSQLQRFGIISLLFLITGLLAMYWSGVVMNNYICYADYNVEHRNISSLTQEANYYLQKQYILSHGTYFFEVFFNSLTNHPNAYLLSYIGCLGTYLDIPLPALLCVLMYIVIIFTALFETNKYSFSLYQKVCLLSAAIAATALLLLSQHLTWDAVGKGRVDLLQGRYFVPVFPLLFMLFNNRIQQKYNIALPVLLAILLVNFTGIKIIYDRFIDTPYISKTGFYCDAEELSSDRHFSTSDPHITLENNKNASSKEHKSGRRSICITPKAPYGLNYKFKDPMPGDMIEISAWRKGNAGDLVVSGRGQFCGDIYFANSNPLIKYNYGWAKMCFYFTIPKNCMHTQLNFFVWNTSSENIYFDDIELKIRKK